MFKNYVRNPNTLSPINLAIARVIVAIYLSWKVLSAHWERVDFSPYPWVSRIQSPRALEILIPDLVLANVVYLQLITVIVLVLFAIGLWLKYTAYLSSFLIAYLGCIHALADQSWSTQMFFAYSILLMLFALYSEEDKVSMSGLVDLSNQGINKLNNHLKSPLTLQDQSNPLKIFLLALGILYFGGIAGKIQHGIFSWVSATNQMRHLEDHLRTGYFPVLRDIVIQYDILLVTGGVVYVTCQFGFIVSILTDKLFNLFVIGWLGIHVMTALVMGPVFVYTVVFLCLFLDWERIISHFQTDSQIEIVYDERCFFCAQSLYFFKYLDINQNVNFYSQTDVPDKFVSDPDIDLDQAMYLSHNNTIYEGYYAFRELVYSLGIFYPIYKFMRVSQVEIIGEKMYRYVASNRSRHFTCAIDEE